jgi:type II secretory pathway pseudopilin PulG
MMGGLKKPQGYTIVEVMIFLAISGVMFMMAISFISGKQTKAQFREGAISLSSDVQSVINDVSNGIFPSTTNLKCTKGSPPSITTAGSGEQGSNEGCIFLGKVIQFNALGAPENFNIYTIAGNQFSPGGDASKLSVNFAEAHPIAVANTPDLTVSRTTNWGLQVTKIIDTSTHKAGNNCAVNPGAIGFFGGLGDYAGNVEKSGAGQVTVVCLPYSYTGASKSSLTDAVLAINDNDVMSGTHFTLCLLGGYNQKASLTIGGNSGQSLVANLELGDAKEPAC